MRQRVVRHRAVAQAAVGLLLVVVMLGCAASPKNAPLTTPADIAVDPSSLQLVGQLSGVWGTKRQRVDGVSLVVGLPGTGSDPPPTSERDVLLSEMQTREVDKPNSVLASSSTALVRVRSLIPPGASKGDHFDLFVEIPRATDTTSIEGGWLMATRLREYAVLENRVAEGHLFALGQGDVLTDALLEAGEDEVSKIRGRVLGGGVVTKSRGFGLVVRDEFTSVKTSSRIGEAVNRRFSVYHNGSKQGVANPKRDNFIGLLVHPRYVGNETRYINVIQNIAVREAPRARSARLKQLKSKLADPSTAALAAVQLEAIGQAGIPALRDALDSKDLEIRFYAAEALAYMDVPDAVEALDAAIRREPAFRWRALTALGAMDDVAAHEVLIGLLHVASAESRYGAFRVLRRRTPDDPMIDGEVVNDSFSLHRVSTTGPPMIHVSRIERPEIVLFGADHEFADPVILFAGNEIVVRSNRTDGVSVSRLSAGEEDASVDCSRRVIDVVRAIAQLEGTYADVVHALTEGRRTGCLKSRLEFSAIPTIGRTYRRGTTEADLLDDDQQPLDSPGAEPQDLQPESIDLAVDDLSLDGPPERRSPAALPPNNAGSPDLDVRPDSTAGSPAGEPSVESSGRSLPDLTPAALAARSAPRQAAPNASTAPVSPAAAASAAPMTRTNPIPSGTKPLTSSSVLATAPDGDPNSPLTLAEKTASELRKAPPPAISSLPTRLGAAQIPIGEVAPLPPEMGPVLNFTDLIDPETLPD